jgi:photosystem II stability/assembly factor-like uncharacterized protein
MTTKFFVSLASMSLILFLFVSCSEDTPPVDDQQYKGWVVGQAESGFGTILSTSNDGLTWVRQGSQSQAAGVDLYDIHGYDQNTVWAVGGIYKGYGLILHSIDGGVSWIRQGTSTTIPNVRLYAIHAVNSLNLWAAGENNVLINSKDGGTTWTSVSLGVIPNSVFYAITSFGNSSLWAVGAAADTSYAADTVGIIMHSADGGTTWSRQGATYAFPKKFFDASAGNDSILYVCGTQSVYKSLNGGSVWQQVLNAPNRNLNGICAVDVENVWTVGDYDGVYHSTNGGTYWDTIIPSIKGFRLQGVTVADVNRIWIVGAPSSGFGKGSIIYSRNAGDTWFIEPVPVEAGFRRVSFSAARR